MLAGLEGEIGYLTYLGTSQLLFQRLSRSLSGLATTKFW